MQNKMIKEYLSYFPEYQKEFNMYWSQVNNMIRLIHHTYMNFRVNKNHPGYGVLDLVPYELKPLMGTLHGHHLTPPHPKITRDWVEEYFKNLPIKKIIFVINYQRNQQRRLEREQAMEETLEPTIEITLPIEE
jgi:hypothetical protein